jgi:hypothetical protein
MITRMTRVIMKVGDGFDLEGGDVVGDVGSSNGTDSAGVSRSGAMLVVKMAGKPRRAVYRSIGMEELEIKASCWVFI